MSTNKSQKKGTYSFHHRNQFPFQKMKPTLLFRFKL
jgi:hypothetical protein